MPRQKEQPTVEQHMEQFKNFPLPDQIAIYKAIEKHLEETKAKAQQVHNQLNGIVKEKN